MNTQQQVDILRTGISFWSWMALWQDDGMVREKTASVKEFFSDRGVDWASIEKASAGKVDWKLVLPGILTSAGQDPLAPEWRLFEFGVRIIEVVVVFDGGGMGYAEFTRGRYLELQALLGCGDDALHDLFDRVLRWECDLVEEERDVILEDYARMIDIDGEQITGDLSAH